MDVDFASLATLLRAATLLRIYPDARTALFE
jgi:hypothetical protein